MYNFEAFMKQHEGKFNNCKYPYFANKCKAIIRKLFFKQDVSKEEKDMLENRLGISAEEWQKLIKEYNNGPSITKEQILNCVDSNWKFFDKLQSAKLDPIYVGKFNFSDKISYA